ncbi:hypothetical protein MRB53_040416 [Persea americana]|nr:hypothetical protein MRB53_040416 [Persea americana]
MRHRQNGRLPHDAWITTSTVVAPQSSHLFTEYDVLDAIEHAIYGRLLHKQRQSALAGIIVLDDHYLTLTRLTRSICLPSDHPSMS